MALPRRQKKQEAWKRFLSTKPGMGDHPIRIRSVSESVGIIAANIILLVLSCHVASAAGLQSEAWATQGTDGSQRRVRDATPRRITAPVAFDFSDQPAYADAAYTIRPGWTIIPDFKLGEAYTDNVTLTSSETLDDFVTVLKPGVQV
ncbi:MAG: hypothetical protein MN733_00130, partial [Nitrososphaera sp.]|nr:hypothetical protein [Nitrososphaera sp.]